MKKKVIRVSTCILAMAAFLFVGRLSVSADSTVKAPAVDHSLITVACIGDSITFGLGVKEDRGNTYPALLQGMLGEKYLVLNYGESGSTMVKEGDKPYWEEDLFVYSRNAEPDIVLLMLGTNDSKPQNWNAEEFAKDMMEMVALYQSLPSEPRVYLLTSCVAYTEAGKTKPRANINNHIIANQIIPIIREVAEATACTVIDINTATQEHPEYFTDGIHPNAEGNRVIAETVYAELSTKK